MKRIGFVSLVVAAIVLIVACGGAEPTATLVPPTNTPVPPTATAAPPTSAPLATATTAAPTATVVAPTATRVPVTATPTIPPVKLGGKLRIYMTRNLETQDLHKTRNSTAWAVTVPQMNYLVATAIKYGIYPDLASSWNVSGDGLTYTFNLNPDAKWQDGKPVTADDIVFSLRRIKGLEDIKNPLPAFSNTMNAVSAIEAVDAKTVRVKLSQPSGGWLGGLGVIGNAMYKKDQNPADYLGVGPPIGSGPFKFVSFQGDIKAVLVRNENYWKKDEFGRRLPYVDALDVFVITDQSAERAAFYTNQVDQSFNSADPWSGHTKELQQRIPGVQFGRYKTTQVLFLNGTRKPFDDQRIRTALQLAIDRQQAADLRWGVDGDPYTLYNVVGGAYALTADELKTWPGFNPNTRQQDVAKAKELLAAGLKDAGLSLDTWQPELVTRQIWVEYAQIVADQYKKNLGLNVKISALDNPTALDRQAKLAFDFEISGLATIADDPYLNMGAYTLCGAGTNYGQYCDKDLDAQLAKLDATIDLSARQKLSKDLERRIYDLAWQIIMTSEPRTIVARPELHGVWQIATSQDGYPYLRERVWLDR